MQFVTDNRFCGKPSDAMVKGQKKHRGAPFYAGDASTLAHAKVDLEGLPRRLTSSSSPNLYCCYFIFISRFVICKTPFAVLFHGAVPLVLE